MWLPDDFKGSDGAAFVRKQLLEAKKLSDLMRRPIFPNGSNNPEPIFVANGFLKTWSRVYFDPQSGAINGHTEVIGDRTVILYSAINGVSRNLRVSSREHEHVFDGKEVRLVLETSLQDRVPTSGSGSAMSSFQDLTGKEFKIESLAYDAIPRSLPAESAGTFLVKLSGEDSLKEANLTAVAAQLIPQGLDPIRLTLSSDRTESAGPSVTRELTFTYNSPALPGPHILRVSVPGLGSFDEILLVTKTER